MRLRHTSRLLRELSRYIVEQRLWWMIPLIACLLLVALAATATTHAVPVAVYTLF